MEEKSEELKCEIFKTCGGCSLLNVDYPKQLLMKNLTLKQLFKKKLNMSIKINPILGMDNPYHYRNKGKYVIGKQKEKYQMGLYREGTHEILHTTSCKLHQEKINEVAEECFHLIQKYKITPYDEEKKRGIIRHLIIRYGVHTQEIMIIFVTINQKIARREAIVKELLVKFQI